MNGRLEGQPVHDVRPQPLTEDDPVAVGPYEIVGRLGEGGMGSVYLGRSPVGVAAAVKLIRPELAQDEGFRRRFAAEVDNAQRVASFCTAAVLGHGRHGDRPYLATEYIEGPTLRAYVAEQGALPPSTLQSFAVGVAAALTAIHAAGLVHRDLKPSNVILSVTGPRVIDFGIARALDDSSSMLTASGEVVGSPGWLAPEQLLRDVTHPAADIYTWGCLVAYAGRARHPYGSGDVAAMSSRALHAEPALDGLPEPIARLVETAMAKDPRLRPTARQLLLTLVGGSVPAADAVSGPPSEADPTALLAAATRLDLAPPAGFAPAPDEPGLTAVAPSPDPVEPGRGRRLLLGGLIFVLGLALLVAGALALPR
ncbi:serine/threonine-protein kinase [Actinomadura scrupuli]|uniref:serine/threonine-protein kinase n=1 Tax=Actinomadura scrupuli TaxID=559629 RepID=UPI003D9878F4